MTSQGRPNEYRPFPTPIDNKGPIPREANEQNAFLLVTTLVMFVPKQNLEPYMKPLFSVILTVLSKRKKPRFKRLATNFFAVISGKYGAQDFFNLLSSIQGGLGMNLFANVWVSRLVDDPPVRLDSKTQVLGLTRVIFEISDFFRDENSKKVWAVAVRAIMSLVSSPNFRAGAGRDAAEDEPIDVEIAYDSSYSSLQFAKRAMRDPLPESGDPIQVFAQGLGRLNVKSPGMIRPLIEGALQSDPKMAVAFQKILASHQIAI